MRPSALPDGDEKRNAMPMCLDGFQMQLANATCKWVLHTPLETEREGHWHGLSCMLRIKTMSLP
eukprot:5719707-Amphidinium_carterae.1